MNLPTNYKPLEPDNKIVVAIKSYEYNTALQKLSSIKTSLKILSYKV